MLESHYAPSCRVILVDDADAQADAASRARPGSVVLDLTDDLAVYARDALRLVASRPTTATRRRHRRAPAGRGLGHAIRDRLVKAARARDSG